MGCSQSLCSQDIQQQLSNLKRRKGDVAVTKSPFQAKSHTLFSRDVSKSESFDSIAKYRLTKGKGRKLRAKRLSFIFGRIKST